MLLLYDQRRPDGVSYFSPHAFLYLPKIERNKIVPFSFPQFSDITNQLFKNIFHFLKEIFDCNGDNFLLPKWLLSYFKRMVLVSKDWFATAGDMFEISNGLFASAKDRFEISNDPSASAKERFEVSNDPFASAKDRFEVSKDPFASAKDRFEVSKDPFASANDRFEVSNDPFAAAKGWFIRFLVIIALFRDLITSVKNFNCFLRGKLLSPLFN